MPAQPSSQGKDPGNEVAPASAWEATSYADWLFNEGLTLRRRANARNVSFRISLRWPIYIVNSVDKTKLSCNTPNDAAPQFL